MNFLFFLVVPFGLTKDRQQQGAAFKERKMEWSELPQKAGTAALLTSSKGWNGHVTHIEKKLQNLDLLKERRKTMKN